MKTNKTNGWVAWARSTLCLFALMPIAGKGCDLESYSDAVAGFSDTAARAIPLPVRMAEPASGTLKGQFSLEAKP